MDGATDKAKLAVKKILKLGQENGFSVYQPAEKEKWLKFARSRGLGIHYNKGSARIARTIERAVSGDPKAIDAVRSSIADVHFAGVPLPKVFADYLAKKFIEPKSIQPYASRTAETDHRNYYIAWAVQVATDCGLQRSRGEITKFAQPERISACSLVASLLSEFGISITEDRVLRIANQWRDMPPFSVGKMDASEYR